MKSCKKLGSRLTLFMAVILCQMGAFAAASPEAQFYKHSLNLASLEKKGIVPVRNRRSQSHHEWMRKQKTHWSFRKGWIKAKYGERKQLQRRISFLQKKLHRLKRMYYGGKPWRWGKAKWQYHRFCKKRFASPHKVKRWHSKYRHHYRHHRRHHHYRNYHGGHRRAA